MMRHLSMESGGAERGGLRSEAIPESGPECVYFEATNRCNYLCATCPRYFNKARRHSELGPEEAALVTSQLPGLKRAVLHGVGEPLMNGRLPGIIAHFKGRGIHASFNTNGSLMDERWQSDLIDSGLDELRVSLNASDARTYSRIHRSDTFEGVVGNIRGLISLKNKLRVAHPRVSLWALALRETIGKISEFARLAADLGVQEVYLQRLVYREVADDRWLARKDQSLYISAGEREAEAILEAEATARALGLSFAASGAGGALESLTRKGDGRPWSDCRRPWTTIYISAEGSVYPCCMAPFVGPAEDGAIVGRLSEGLGQVWRGEPYKRFRKMLLGDEPPGCCSGCGVNWSL